MRDALTTFTVRDGSTWLPLTSVHAHLCRKDSMLHLGMLNVTVADASVYAGSIGSSSGLTVSITASHQRNCSKQQL